MYWFSLRDLIASVGRPKKENSCSPMINMTTKAYYKKEIRDARCLFVSVGGYSPPVTTTSGFAVSTAFLS